MYRITAVLQATGNSFLYNYRNSRGLCYRLWRRSLIDAVLEATVNSMVLTMPHSHRTIGRQHIRICTD